MKPTENQMCSECGRSVSLGSGLFVNRVHDLNSIATRKRMGRPYPKGDFICPDCDAWTPKSEGEPYEEIESITFNVSHGL